MAKGKSIEGERLVFDQHIGRAVQVAEIAGMERWADSPEVAMMEGGGGGDLAEIIQNRPRGLHVDVGSGFGRLLGELWKINKEGVYLGVDINQHNM